MIDVDPEARISVYDYVGLKAYIAGLFDGPVDVVSRDGLKPYVRPIATADADYAFCSSRHLAPRHFAPYSVPIR